MPVSQEERTAKHLEYTISFARLHMISFDLGNHKFQLRAAAVIVHEGSALLHRVKSDDFWALPGGRVELGEDSSHTVVREMYEELHASVTCHRLLFLVENFFLAQGKLNHEIGMYFEAALAPDSHVLGKAESYAGVEANSNLEFRWFRQCELQSIDLRPAFLKKSLAEPVLSFAHIVQRE